MQFQASAIVSCYKSKNFIKHKIRNILESSAHMQIVIIECNNGQDLCCDTNFYPLIKTIILKERIPIWKAINIGINNADAPYVVQANTDDLVHPDAYSLQINKLNEGYDISYFNYYISDGYHNNWDHAVSKAYTYYKTPASGYSVGNGLGMFPMWRKSLHLDLGYFDENLEVYGDSLFWEKLVTHQKRFGHIDKILGVYAQRPGENLESRLGYKDREYLLKIRNQGTPHSK